MMQSRFFYRLLVVCCLLGCVLVLQACAPRIHIPEGQVAPEATAKALWSSFEAYSAERGTEQGPYVLKGSLRYGDEGDTRRVSLLLWSNGGLPIRLDVLAGVNTTAARLLEDVHRFVAYAPSESKAIVHNGYQRVQLNFGKPVPFALRDFTALMRGRFLEVFGPARGINPRLRADGGVAYTLTDGFLEGVLTLNSAGLPVQWDEPGEGWSMTIGYDDESPLRPYKFRLTRTGGYSALLLVKDREQPQNSFSAGQLGLTLPADTVIEDVKKQ